MMPDHNASLVAGINTHPMPQLHATAPACALCSVWALSTSRASLAQSTLHAQKRHCVWSPAPLSPSLPLCLSLSPWPLSVCFSTKC